MDAISPFLTSYQIINLGSFSRGILERPKLAFRFHEASVGAIKIVLIHEILKELPIFKWLIMHVLATTTCIGKIFTTKYLRRSSRLHEVGYPAPDTNLEFIPSPYLFVLLTLE